MKGLVTVDTVEHTSQRYDTWADWEVDWMVDLDDPIDVQPVPNLKVTVSRVNNWRYEYLSFLHEFLEATLCLHLGISQAQVDHFDIDYEERRMKGERWAACGCEITDDPGSDLHAPYRVAHLYAESVEYGLAKLLEVDPKEYDAAFIALDGGVAGNRK